MKFLHEALMRHAMLILSHRKGMNGHYSQEAYKIPTVDSEGRASWCYSCHKIFGRIPSARAACVSPMVLVVTLICCIDVIISLVYQFL